MQMVLIVGLVLIGRAVRAQPSLLNVSYDPTRKLTAGEVTGG